MTFASELVDWSALGQVILISAVAGIVITFCMALAVVTSLRAQDDRAAGNKAAADGLNVVTVLAVLVVVAAVGTGIYFIASK
jgi:hypothetical protein